MEDDKKELIIYETPNGKLDIQLDLENETIWLTQRLIAQLFECSTDNVGVHLKNIYESGELEENRTTEFFSVVQKEGNREVTRDIEYYNLDMILSVGYRVKSDKGIIFRKWANKILKDYMLKGYAINQRRLDYLEKTVKLIDIANRIDERLEGNDAKEILKVIGGYTKALDLLDDYDHRTLKKFSIFNSKKSCICRW